MIRVFSIFAASCSVFTGSHASDATIDFLSGHGLSHFQPVEDWHRVKRAVNVPDRMELTTSGKDGGVLVNGLLKDIALPYLMTVETFADVRVELEFMIPRGSNAGVYMMGRYEVQILDSYGKGKVGSGDLGGIYGSRNPSLPEGKRWVPGSKPLTNAANPPGRWQKMEIVFRAPRFDAKGAKIADARFDSVKINGKLVQKDVTCTYPTVSHPLPGEVAAGPIAVQGDHGPIAIRKFTATPLDSPGTAALAGIDAYWKEVERSVREGDYAAYCATVHPDAVIISGSKQASYPLRQALIRWEKDFENTKSGELTGDVRFRFSRRYNGTETALESGIFQYISTPKDGEPTTDYVAFEALLAKKDGRWLMLMENQIGAVSEEEWEALSP